MGLINIQKVTFAYPGGENVFNNLSLTIDTSWKLGLIGRNGRGKTTFLKLLQGCHEFQGSITANVPFDYFPYEVGEGDLTVYDLLQTISPASALWEAERELAWLNMEAAVLQKAYNLLSKGEQNKIKLAALFLKSGCFLLIDEPTSHLDLKAREVVASYLKAKQGFILVSHDRWLLDQSVDHVLSLNRHGVELQKGNFSSWQHNRIRQDNYELNQNQKLKKDIKRLEVSAQHLAGWSKQAEKTKKGCGPVDRGFLGHKAQKMMQRSKSVQNRIAKALNEQKGLLKNVEAAEQLMLPQLPCPFPKLLECSGLSLDYGQGPLFADLSFALKRGERIAVCGKNGSGKSSILRFVRGELKNSDAKFSGCLYRPNQLIISSVGQETTCLQGNLKGYVHEHGLPESLFLAILRKLGIGREQFYLDLAAFSQGQKKKVLIAASLCHPAHLFVWDEPLNYIDVVSRIQIEKLILQQKASMLLVEHDRAFLEKIGATLIWI